MLTPATRTIIVWLPLLRGSTSAFHSPCAAADNELALRSEGRSAESLGCLINEATTVASSNNTRPIGALLLQRAHWLAPLFSSESLTGSTAISTRCNSRQYSSYKGGNDSSRGSAQGVTPGRLDRTHQPRQQANLETRSSARLTPTPAQLPHSNQHSEFEPTHRSSTPPIPAPLTNAILLQITTFDQMRYALSSSLSLSKLPQLLQAMTRLVQIHRQQGLFEALPLAQHMAENITLCLLPHVPTLSSSSTTELLWCMAQLGLPNLGNTRLTAKTTNPSNRHRKLQPTSEADSASDGVGGTSVSQALADAVCPLQSGLLARLQVLGWGEFTKQDASRVVWAAAKLQQRQRTSSLRWQLTPGVTPGLGDTLWWDNLATAMLPATASPTHMIQEGEGGLQVEDWADVVWAFGLVAYKGRVRGKLCAAAADALLQRNTFETAQEEEQKPMGRGTDRLGGLQGGWGGAGPSQQTQAGARGGAQQGTGLGDGFFLNASSGRIASLLHSLAVMEQYHPDVMQRGVQALLEHGSTVRPKVGCTAI